MIYCNVFSDTFLTLPAVSLAKSFSVSHSENSQFQDKIRIDFLLESF